MIRAVLEFAELICGMPTEKVGPSDIEDVSLLLLLVTLLAQAVKLSTVDMKVTNLLLMYAHVKMR